MDMYEEMRKEINKFCNSYPPAGCEINYLENAKEIYSLFADASAILDEPKSAVDADKVQEIYAKIKKLAN